MTTDQMMRPAWEPVPPYRPGQATLRWLGELDQDDDWTVVEVHVDTDASGHLLNETWHTWRMGPAGQQDLHEGPPTEQVRGQWESYASATWLNHRRHWTTRLVAFLESDEPADGSPHTAELTADALRGHRILQHAYSFENPEQVRTAVMVADIWPGTPEDYVTVLPHLMLT